MISFFTGLPSRLWGYALGALAILAALGEIYRRGRKSGIEKMEREQDQLRAKAIADRKALDDELANTGHADLDQRINRWVRNDKVR